MCGRKGQCLGVVGKRGQCLTVGARGQHTPTTTFRYVAIFKKLNYNLFIRYIEGTEEYSQLVWAETTQVGCGLVYYQVLFYYTSYYSQYYIIIG